MIDTRKPNVFEKIVLIIGIIVVVVGYSFIQQMYLAEGAKLSWDLLQTMFLWLVLAVFMIMVAVNENVKEELKVIINEHLEEIRLLREDLKARRARKKAKKAAGKTTRKKTARKNVKKPKVRKPKAAKKTVKKRSVSAL